MSGWSSKPGFFCCSMQLCFLLPTKKLVFNAVMKKNVPPHFAISFRAHCCVQNILSRLEIKQGDCLIVNPKFVYRPLKTTAHKTVMRHPRTVLGQHRRITSKQRQKTLLPVGGRNCFYSIEYRTIENYCQVGLKKLINKRKNNWQNG